MHTKQVFLPLTFFVTIYFSFIDNGLCDGEAQDMAEVQPHGGDCHGGAGHAERAGK